MFKKLTSIVLALIMALGILAVVPMTASAVGPDASGACNITAPAPVGNQYGISFNQALALAKQVSGRAVEITLLQDVTVPGDITLQDEESIMLYLRDYTLIIEGALIMDGYVPFEIYGPGTCEIGSVTKSNSTTSTTALYAYGNDTKVTVNGDVNLINCTNSEGVYVSSWDAEVIVKGNVNCSGNGNVGVDAGFYSTVEIQGDVTVNGAGVWGVMAATASVTVDGKINVPDGENYIYCKQIKAEGDYEAVSSKPGYLEYKSTDSTTFVWVGNQEAHQHDYAQTVIPPTCTEGGYITFTCECGDTYDGYHIPPIPHIPGNWVVITEPQIGVEGLRERSCAICELLLDSEVIPPLTEPTDPPEPPAPCGNVFVNMWNWIVKYIFFGWAWM